MSQPQISSIEALAKQAYTDPAIFSAEQQRIFTSTWQFVCHVEKLRQPGDYIVCQVAGESLILIRQDQKTINALYNVCTHRGARLLTDEGCKRRISCPYHGWTFNTAGELIAAPNAANVAGFELSDHCLQSCRVEQLNGLVFVNLDGNARPLREQVPELAADLKKFAPDLSELTLVHRTEAHIQANWKLGIENYAECYHCELIHKQLVSSVLDFDSYQIRVFERSQRHLSRPQTGTAKAYEFDDSLETEFAAWWMWPNFAFQNYPGGRVHVWTWTPIDVEHTHLTVDWYFPKRKMADWERQLIQHHASTTFAEDLAIIDSVQQGMSSRGYQPGPLMIDADQSRYSEHAVAAIQQWWRDAMGGAYEC